MTKSTVKKPGGGIEYRAFRQLAGFALAIRGIRKRMVPRHVRVLAELPKLRNDGVTADMFDREAAGIVVKRENIGMAR